MKFQAWLFWTQLLFIFYRRLSYACLIYWTLLICIMHFASDLLKVQQQFCHCFYFNHHIPCLCEITLEDSRCYNFRKISFYLCIYFVFPKIVNEFLIKLNWCKYQEIIIIILRNLIMIKGAFKSRFKFRFKWALKTPENSNYEHFLHFPSNVGIIQISVFKLLLCFRLFDSRRGVVAFIQMEIFFGTNTPNL